MRRNRVDLSTGGGLGALLLWSATFAFARSLSEQVGALIGCAAVYLIGGCFCLLRFASSSGPLTWFLQLPRVYLLGCGSLFVFNAYALALVAAISWALYSNLTRRWFGPERIGGCGRGDVLSID